MNLRTIKQRFKGAVDRIKNVFGVHPVGRRYSRQRQLKQAVKSGAISAAAAIEELEARAKWSGAPVQHSATYRELLNLQARGL